MGVSFVITMVIIMLNDLLLARTGGFYALRRALVYLPQLLLLLILEPFLSPEVAPILEHIPRVRMEGPKRALAGFVWGSGYLHETVIEAEGMPNGILPTLLILPVEWKEVHDELIDFRQGQHLVGIILDRHGDKADVAVGWFGMCIASTVGTWLLHPRSLENS